MGRVKSLGIKRAGVQLVEGSHNFTADFDHNKKMLKDTMPSKLVRNKVAGYITRLVRNQNQKAQVPVKETE